MTSNWALPRIIDQYAEDGAENAHISWIGTNQFEELKVVNSKSVKTARDLLHIAREPKHDITEKTYYLRLRNFDFISLPVSMTGIEVRISMNRFGRITDDTVQLLMNDNIIGKNQANLDVSPIKIYGNSSDLWETNLTVNDVQSSTFGILLRFKSHPKWPHKSSAFIDAVEIRIT